MLKIILALGLLIAGTSVASAQTKSPSDKRAHIVTRTYQLVYGGPEMCTRLALPDAKEAVTAAERFKATYPELMSLIEQSPHLDIARERNRKMVEDGVAYAAKYPQSDSDCKGTIGLLTYMIDDPAGQAQVRKTIENLKK